MRSLLIIIVCIFYFSGLRAQSVPVSVKHESIYDFIDELANEKVIEISTVVKPYTRSFILKQLQIVSIKQEQLSHRQQKDLQFYLRVYGLNDQKPVNPYSSTAKMNIFSRESHFNSGINPLGIFYKDSVFTFSIKPIWGIRYAIHQNSDLRRFWGGAEAYFTVGKHWGFYASLVENNMTEPIALPTYLVDYEGGNYKINSEGINATTYSEMKGGITYSWPWGSIGIVKDHIQWGSNYNGPIIYSGRTPSYGMIKLHLYPVKWLEFNYIYGQLVSEVIDSSRSYYTSNGDWRAVYRDKYIASNLFTFKPFKSFYFSLGNSIVYSDISPQLVYFIPFLFYKSVDHTLSHGIDNQNSQMFLDFSFRMIKHFHLYGTLFIDDFSVTRINDNGRQNFIGRKIGGKFSNWPVKNTYMTLEYTKTNPIVYKHRIPSVTFETNQFGLGHYLRDNSDEYYFNIGIKPTRGIRVEFAYLMARHGNEYQYTDGHEAEKLPFLESTTWSNENYSFTILYEFISESYLYFQYQHSNIKGFDVDGISAQEYLDTYSPKFFHGQNDIFKVGFNLGF